MQNRRSSVSNSIVSPDVYIGEDVTIEDSILLPGVRIGNGARLRRAIVEEGIHIPARVTAGFDAEHDRKYHTVTRDGVVVIHQIPASRKPAVLTLVLPAPRKEQNAMEFTA